MNNNTTISKSLRRLNSSRRVRMKRNKTRRWKKGIQGLSQRSLRVQSFNASRGELSGRCSSTRNVSATVELNTLKAVVPDVLMKSLAESRDVTAALSVASVSYYSIVNSECGCTSGGACNKCSNCLSGDDAVNLLHGVVEEAYDAKNMARAGLLGLLLLSLLATYVDLVTDIMLIHQYWSRGYYSEFIATSVIVGLQIVMETLYAVAGMGSVSAFVAALFGLLPIVSSFRVHSGEASDQTVPPAVVLAMCRISELVLRSLPQAVLQTMVLLRPGGANTLLQYISIASSLISIAFTATLTDFSMDTSSQYRLYEPSLYGVYPDKWRDRFLLFIGFMLFIGGHCTGKVLALSVASSAMPVLLVVWILCEVSAFQLVKVWKKNWWLYYGVGFVPSLFVNLCIYLTTLAVPVNVVRQPLFMSPRWWCYLILYQQLNSFILIGVANSQQHDYVYTTTEFILIEVCCTLVSALGVAIAWYKMSPSHRITFYRKRDIHEHVGDILWNQPNYLYHGCTVEESRAGILTSFSYKYWPTQIVKDWLVDNWTRWIDTRPRWFTEKWRNNLPIHITSSLNLYRIYPLI